MKKLKKKFLEKKNSRKKKKFDDFLLLAKARKTTYEFSDKQIKKSYINKILEAGRWAPSCTNLQPWHFIVVRNQDTINKLMVECAYYGDFHFNPSLIIVYLLDATVPEANKQHACFMTEGSDPANEAKLCVSISAMNSVYEATSLGIDTCLLSPNRKTARKILNIPKQFETILLVGFGYEKNGSYQKKRTRKKIKDIVSYEQYGSKS